MPILKLIDGTGFAKKFYALVRSFFELSDLAIPCVALRPFAGKQQKAHSHGAFAIGYGLFVY